MKKALTLLILIIYPILLIADNTYIVNTTSKLNVRSGPGTQYDIIYQLKPDNKVYLIEEYNNGWAKIQHSSNIGFVQKKYIVKQAPPQAKKSKKSVNLCDFFDVNYLLYGILALMVIGFICIIFFDAEIVMAILFFILPILIILYAHLSPNPMWFCSPRSVGWIWTCVNVILTIIVLSVCCSAFMGVLGGALKFDIISLILACLYGYTIWTIVLTAITELFIVGLLLIIGSAKSSSYIGTFTDTGGNSYDVFRK